MSLLMDEHRRFLDDRARLNACERAITEIVRPGAVVADLGCGAGILGLFACRAGARRVYAVDDSGLLGLARQMARANGFGDRIEHVHGGASRVVLPEQVDVIVSDMMGRIGFLPGGAEALVIARARWLAPGGTIMPAVVETWVAPIEHPDVFAQVESWREAIEGFDFSLMRGPASRTGYPHAFDADELLAEGAPAARCDYRSDDPEFAGERVTFRVARAGTMHGLAVWFRASLSPSVTLTNAPGASDRINRRNVYLPIDAPVRLAEGDEVSVDLTIRPMDFAVTWSVACRRDGRDLAGVTHSTLQGASLREDPRSVDAPVTLGVHTWAAARATVLALCDGERAVRDIEQAVFERHRDLFSTAARAQAFVADVVSRYADLDPPGASSAWSRTRLTSG